MKFKLFLIFCISIVLSSATCVAQLYTGMSGLIKNPSAEMNNSGDAVIAGYYLDKHFTPGEEIGFAHNGKKYNTFDFSIALTPFEWLEIGYTFTLMKTLVEGANKPQFNHKDRYFSIKVNPLKEGRYYPAIAIGSNDFIGSPGKIHNDGGSGAGYFCNYYIVATKHFIPHGHSFGVDLGYRYVPVSYGKKWQGVIAGATWRPKWIPSLRVIGEWTGNEVNIGADILLWKHLFIQAALIDCRYFSGGIAYKVNLF